MLSGRCAVKVYVTSEEKAAVTALAQQLSRTESWVIRRAISMYAATLGADVALQDRRRGAPGPLPPLTRQKISETKTHRNAERREVRS